jgi:peptidoglycan/LPS O-acetylase OafA/YrhL
MRKEQHIIQLDGLRFFAVFLVMVAHWLQWKWTNPILTNIPFVHGVTMFFVLSGFLITRILLQNRDKYLAHKLKISGLIRSFYLRRFFRIFPIYYLLIFGLLLFDYKNTYDIFPWLLTYTSNIYQSINNTYVGDFNHFWSLAVEEQFYLFWPFVILFVRPKKTLLAIIMTIIIALIIRAFLYVYIDNWMATSYFTLSCMHALGIGALLAYIKCYLPKTEKALSNPIWLYLSVALYISSLIILSYFKIEWLSAIGDEFFFAIAAALLILRAATNGFKFGAKYLLENKFVVYSGKISYGLYVYHLFIPNLFYYCAPKIGLAITNKYTEFIAFYCLTFLVAHVSWLLIEQPILKLKSKVPYMKEK